MPNQPYSQLNNNYPNQQPAYNPNYQPQPVYNPNYPPQQQYNQQQDNQQNYPQQQQYQPAYAPQSGTFNQPQSRIGTNREGYGQEFQVKMMDAPCKNPLYTCLGCFCGCCFVYKQREEILDITGMPYRCCGGSICGCETPEMPKMPCLCLEAFCCTGNAIMVNRYMIRDMYALALDPCDEYLITCAVVLSWVVCILKCIGVLPQDSPCEELVDCFIHLVLGCALAQGQIELDFHQGK